MNERVAKLEAVIGTLATKQDIGETKALIAESKSSIIAWGSGFGVALAAIVVGILLFAINRANPPTAPVQSTQPTIIVVPSLPPSLYPEPPKASPSK